MYRPAAAGDCCGVGAAFAFAFGRERRGGSCGWGGGVGGEGKESMRAAAAARGDCASEENDEAGEVAKAALLGVRSARLPPTAWADSALLILRRGDCTNEEDEPAEDSPVQKLLLPPKEALGELMNAVPPGVASAPLLASTPASAPSLTRCCASRCSCDAKAAWAAW